MATPLKRTFRAGENVGRAIIENREMQYLYAAATSIRSWIQKRMINSRFPRAIEMGIELSERKHEH